MSHLHITNGDTAVALLKAANIRGDYLPWRDILHIGPVPMTNDLASLSLIRASYLAQIGFTDQSTAKASFSERDNIFTERNQYTEVTLWFEHDLYDQLQLIQILSLITHHEIDTKRVTLVNPDQYLGQLTTGDAIKLFDERKCVTAEQTLLANIAWNAYRQPTPLDWYELLKVPSNCLPFLNGAIARSIQELPETSSCLNKTESMMLDLLAHNKATPNQLFSQYCASESVKFHGDMSFFWYLQQLKQDHAEWFIEDGEYLSLSGIGIKVLEGEYKLNRTYLNERWHGGYCISDGGNYSWSKADPLLS